MEDIGEHIKEEKELSQEEIQEKIWDEYYGDFNVEGMHDLFETKELTGRSEKVGRIRKPIMNITLSGCPNCGYPIRAYDPNRGETCCEHCGTVLNYDIIPDEGIDFNSNDKDLPWNQGMTQDELKLVNEIKKSRQKKFQTKEKYQQKVKGTNSKKDWRNGRYFVAIDVISSQLFMTKYQRQTVRDIVSEYPLKEFHKRVGYEVIISGVCRYVLEKQGRKKGFRFNIDPFKSVKMDRNVYKIIKGNCERLKVLGE